MNKDRAVTEEIKTNIIPGIHNYCDRWCERCPFSSRCLSYTLEKEDYDTPESRNMGNKKFWDKLSETFRMTRELIKQAAEDQGIDLEEIDTMENDKLHEKSHEYAEKQPTAIAARKYSSITSEWFYEINHLFSIDFNEEGNSLIVHPTTNHPGVDMDEVEDAVSVIRWYQFQISVKLMRALNGVVMENEDELWNDLPKDSDGSAKVSLIGIDHSIAAWGLLMKNYPAEENSILDMLVYLERLKTDIETEFPNARGFIRPGFDDETIDF